MKDHGRRRDEAENLSRLLVWMSHVAALSVCSRQVWQCGGSIEVLPCARIAHIERAHKPYTEDLTSHVRRNALRVAEVWMDEFKSHVYMAWNVPMEVSEPRQQIYQVCLCWARLQNHQNPNQCVFPDLSD